LMLGAQECRQLGDGWISRCAGSAQRSVSAGIRLDKSRKSSSAI
jgi:hypothetical protein